MLQKSYSANSAKPKAKGKKTKRHPLCEAVEKRISQEPIHMQLGRIIEFVESQGHPNAGEFDLSKLFRYYIFAEDRRILNIETQSTSVALGISLVF